MKEMQFREWLLHDSKPGGMSSGSVSSRISNCRRLENAGYDLDAEFEKDKLNSLIERLEYVSYRDPIADIQIEGDLKSGLATLRSAANLYRRFRIASSIPAKSIDSASASSCPKPPQVGATSEVCVQRSLEQAQIIGSDPAADSNIDIGISSLWFDYMNVLEKLTAKLGRSSNVVGEFAERLVADVYGGDLFTASAASADVILPDGRLIQVKSRVPRQGSATSLGVIRSWDFDLLVVVVFNPDGSIQKAVELDVIDAKRLSAANSHQNGWVISTTDKFYSDAAVRDVTRLFARKLKYEA